MEFYWLDRNNYTEHPEIMESAFGVDRKERPEEGEMVLAGMENGELAGFAAIDLNFLTPRLTLLYVAEAFRGRGIGQELLRELKLFLGWNEIPGLAFEERVSWVYGDSGRKHLDRVADYFKKQGFIVTKWYDKSETDPERYLVVSGNLSLMKGD